MTLLFGARYDVESEAEKITMANAPFGVRIDHLGRYSGWRLLSTGRVHRLWISPG
jgi:hypothetical protein